MPSDEAPQDNDRPDIARLADADGVHLGQDDLPVKEARRILGPEALIGVSTHTLDQVRQLYTEQVSGQVGELVVVGDFDPATIQPQIEGMLKDWKSSVPYRRIEKTAKTDVKGERQVIPLIVCSVLGSNI